MNIKITPFDKNKSWHIPERATVGSSGYDLKASLTSPIIIKSGERALIDTNLSVIIPYGEEAQIRSRSGLAIKHGVFVLNSPGTIDSDFRGSIGIILQNSGKQPFVVTDEMKIAQMVFATIKSVEFKEVDELMDSVRGEGGFGSTGM